ncbi:MAG: glycosyltransferase family 39 protein [Isosphaeraceae bacterium]
MSDGSTRLDAPGAQPRPLLRPVPRSAMFFPLAVIVAVLPGLYALNSWDLTPPGPWWGLRGLAILEGQVVDQSAAAGTLPALEAWAYRTVASQPPLYAWLEALGLALSPERNPLATVLPSYIAGVVVVLLVYLHGRLWRGPGTGLVAAVLTGFSRDLLVQTQQATPTTLALAGALGALLGYAMMLRRGNGAAPDRLRPLVCPSLAGLALGVSLMAVGLFGLMVVPVVILHQLYLRGGNGSGRLERAQALGLRRRVGALLGCPSVRAALVGVLSAAAVAGPWYVSTLRSHGWEGLAALLTPFGTAAAGRARLGLLDWAVRLAPAALPLGLFGAARAAREALTDDRDDPGAVGGAFWALWLGSAALLPACWPGGPRLLGGLFLLVPVNLLAAQVICDLAQRRIPVRTLTWLAPATALTVAWSASANLSGAVEQLVGGHVSASTALGLHLALDLIVGSVWLTHRLDHWARRRDDRQRRVLATFLSGVMAVTVVSGGREVWFRHRETEDLLMLRTMILRRDRERPFTQVAVVGPETFRNASEGDGPAPGGRLRFILRTALPNIPQRDLDEAEDLLKLEPIPPDGQRLVILAGRNQRLPHSIRTRLKLEAIHPGRHGVLDAFATAAPADERPRSSSSRTTIIE